MSLVEKKAFIVDWEKRLSSEVGAQYFDLKNNRTVVRTRVSKSITSLKNSIQGSDVYEIRENLETLRKHHDDLQDRDASIWIFMVDHPLVLEADSEICTTQYSDPCTKMIAIALKRLSELNPQSANSPSFNPTSTTAHIGRPSNVRLPKLQLPTFSGKSACEYKAFWNAFSMIDSDTTLDSIQKLHYLKAACIGEAQFIADGFAVSNHNYDELKAHLQLMFGSKRQIVQAYMDLILDIPHVNQTGLRAFTNTLETALRSVKEYSVNYDHLAPIVIPLMERRLLVDDFKKWKEESHDDEDFSLQKFISFLHERIHCLPA